MNKLFALLLSTLAFGQIAFAQTGRWDETFEFSRVRLVAAKDTLDGSNSVQLGLEFDIADGWNIYWRSPGSVGLPPAVIWQDLSNINSSEIQWPVPSRYTYKFPGEDVGIESMIYAGNPILPVKVEIADPNQPLFARATVEYMVCNDQCIFGEAQVGVDLFVGSAETPLTEHAPRINEFLSQVPVSPTDGMDAGLGLVRHTYDADAQTMTFDLRSAIPFSAPDVFVEAPEDTAGFVFGAPAIAVSEDKRGAIVTVPVDEVAYSGATPSDVDLRLTLVDGGRGQDLGFVRLGTAQGLTTATWATEAGNPAAQTTSGSNGFGPDGWGLWVLVLAAIAAGFILNFMPCVLPVLSLKMMAFVGKADQDNGQIRASFLATTAGIIASFWLLAGLVIVLQALGNGVGWGFQFQSPWFVSTMVAIMVIFAANMFGWFELPAIPGLAAVGAGKQGLGADFLTGALATLLATPCSAPLLAPVIGVAFAGNALTVFGLFTLIGVGLAAPYWLVVIFPVIARIMPRPGRWMMVLKAILGLLLLAFAQFMIWVLMTQLGAWVAGVALVLSGLALLILFLRKAAVSGLLQPAALFAAVAALPIASAVVLPNQQLAMFSSPSKAGDIDWIAFDQAQISQLVGEGKTVFVDVTASWCVNCKFNKAVALDPAPVKQAFADPNIVAMIADWTNHDESIGTYLAGFNRAGIPFNVVYSPEHPTGKPLPTALSQEIVLAALDR